jgi:hypothetical protein
LKGSLGFAKDMNDRGQAWWLTSVIPATWETEIGGFGLKTSHPRKKVSESLSQRTSLA